MPATHVVTKYSAFLFAVAVWLLPSNSAHAVPMDFLVDITFDGPDYSPVSVNDIPMTIDSDLGTLAWTLPPDPTVAVDNEGDLVLPHSNWWKIIWAAKKIHDVLHPYVWEKPDPKQVVGTITTELGDGFQLQSTYSVDFDPNGTSDIIISVTTPGFFQMDNLIPEGPSGPEVITELAIITRVDAQNLTAEITTCMELANGDHQTTPSTMTAVLSHDSPNTTPIIKESSTTSYDPATRAVFTEPTSSFECPGIPTVSQWGFAVMILLVLAVGTVIMRKRAIAEVIG